MELSELKGVGPKTQKTLELAGIKTTNDLVSYYPYRYQIIARSKELIEGTTVIVDGVVETNATLFYFGKRKDRMNFKLNTGKELLSITIFNRGYLKNKILAGTEVYIIGKYEKKNNSIIASDIVFGLLPDHEIIKPIYHSINSISNNQLKNLIDKALTISDIKDEIIPQEIINKYHFNSLKTTLNIIHNPDNQKDLKKATDRIKYEELFMFMLKMNYLKMNKDKNYGLSRTIDKGKVDEFISELPFSLTSDQLKCTEDIYNDLTSERRMNRLVQGDVGSGKTIISFIAMYMNYLSGYQSALMAPTEILAIQHHLNLKKLLGDKLNIEILTGKTKAKEKREISKKLEEGKIDIIIGTHALLSESLSFNNLGLVVTDEQHRFGVNQRATLKNKGITPDILYMSATPIPRTYALTLYGDMDVSNIHTMPSGRKPVITKIKKNTEIKDVLHAMLKELKLRHQIYVVAPMIEENESSDYTNVNELYDNMEKAFGKLYNLGLLHGKMKNKEKDEVMSKFKNNETQILISTTVIEVGVDVSNATMIVIFNSERFGLSTLHQLRGRVGRNSLDSYCYLISDYEKERLHVLEQTNDGFKISEEDFKLRGGGDLFGLRQSGDMSFKMADIKRDFNILLHAKEDSENYLKSKGYQENIALRNLIERRQLD